MSGRSPWERTDTTRTPTQNDGSGNGELGYHDYLLYTVSEAVSAFYRDLAAHGQADRVVVFDFSEFGRRPEEN